MLGPVVRDEFHLEEELAQLRARVGAYSEPRPIPPDREFQQLAADWAENVWWALAVIRGMAVTRDECQALGEEMASLQIEAERRQVEDGAREDRRRRVRDDVCQRLRGGAGKAASAEAAGISRDTLLLWERGDPQFRQRVREALAAGEGPRKERLRQRTPAKMRPGVRRAIVAALADGVSRGQAAARAGVSRQTFYTWLRRAPDFRRDVLDAEDTASRAVGDGGLGDQT